MPRLDGVGYYEASEKLLVKYKKLERHKYSPNKSLAENLQDENKLLKEALLEAIRFIRR